MKCTSVEQGYYAVVRRWSDNPHDVEVVEYASTIQQANKLAKSIPPAVLHMLKQVERTLEGKEEHGTRSERGTDLP